MVGLGRLAEGGLEFGDRVAPAGIGDHERGVVSRRVVPRGIHLIGGFPDGRPMLTGRIMTWPPDCSVAEDASQYPAKPVSYTHLRAHETRHDLVCRLLLE